MKPWITAAAVFAAVCSTNARANDYPTLERVDAVLTCMKQNGGQNIDNLQRCSCEIDAISEVISLDDYNEARTYEIYKQMPGERGGLFRDTDRAKEMLKKLEGVRTEATRHCLLNQPKQVKRREHKAEKPES
ncbi:MAG: hypothetical protein HY749_21575 [Gammaproteobacteria bacterium]|nr:hypothetical protein [Gammaproteobacteria bacterium]MBI5618881.1 hypothetical protein [Gammaproteobacteria bacterium]